MAFSRASGFTLVELAISLMIIGLLIGGVLKGQELIQNAKDNTIIRQIDAYQTATRIFYTTYQALPGDMKTPSTRLPDCTATPCSTAGDQDGYINASLGGTTLGYMLPMTGLMGAYEARNFFLHLAKAGMITGINAASTSATFTAFGEELPAIKDGENNGIGVMIVGAQAASPLAESPETANYFVVRNASYGGVALKPATAASIDKKMDNGLANRGDVQALGTETGNAIMYGCTVNSSGDAYIETSRTRVCNLSIKFSVNAN